MKKTIAVLALGTIGMSGPALAQSALELATQGGACGGGEILAAEFLGDGRIQVRCPPGTGATSTGTAGGATPAALAGTALGTEAAAGLLAAVALLAAASGGSGAATTTTTSP